MLNLPIFVGIDYHQHVIQVCVMDGAKNKEYGEGKHVLGRKSWGGTWTILTNMAVSLTNVLHQGERTLREVREKCSRNPATTANSDGKTKLVDGLR